MICLRCGYCCKKYTVAIVKDPAKGLREDNLIVHKGNGPCLHLRGKKPGKYSCAIHNELWYDQTPCFSHSQFETKETNCRLGEYVLEKKGKI